MKSLTRHAGWLALSTALLIVTQLPAQTSDNELTPLYKQGMQAWKENRWKEAQRLLGQVVDNISADFKAKNPYLYGQMLSDCGYADYKVGECAKAERRLSDGLVIREKQVALGAPAMANVRTGRPALAESKIRLGYLYVLMNRFVEARPLFEEVQQLGGDGAECEYYLGWISRATGQFDAAKRHHDAALIARQQQIAELETNLRANPKDEKLQAQRVSAYRLVAHLRNDRGLLFEVLGQYGTARTEFEAAAKLWDYVDRQDRSPDKANCLMNLGNLCRDLGDFGAAAAHLERSAKILNEVPDHPDRALLLLNQGIFHATVFFRSKDPADEKKALECCTACLGLCERLPGSANTALTLSNLGWLFHGMDRLNDAERAYARSLQLWRDKLPQHPDHARTLCNAGWLRHCQGDSKEALRLYEAGRKLRIDTLGAQHHCVACSTVNLAALHGSTADIAKASAAMTDALQRLRAYESRELAYLPDADQLSFLLHPAKHDSHASIFHCALSLVRTGRDDPALVAASAEWVLNGKAVSHEALAQKTLQSRDPRNAELVRKLARVRTGLGQLTANPPDGKVPKAVAAHRQEFEKLQAEERAHEDALAKALQAQNAGQPVESWIALEQVRAGVPKDAVLIEIARYRVWNFQSKKRDPWEGEQYGAWIIPPRGAIRFVDLGAAGPIDAAADALQAAMVDAEKLYNARDLAGLKAQEARLRTGPLRQLQEQVVGPLRSAIDPNTTRWIVSPDANLWLAPLAALPQDNGKFLVESHNISYVVSGRELVARAPVRQPKASVVLAAPTYGAGVRNLGQLGKIVFPPLHNAAVEAKAVADRLHDVGPHLQGNAATESAFRALDSPRVLHLVTHGFALRKSEDAQLPQDPLSLCGLALVGANDPNLANRAGDEDGLLLGKEVLAADLRGTELVTLSACQTGLGRVSSGESVASLRQAFHLAGAQNVVATLWSIPDTESAQLIASFYEQMKRNPQQGRGDALCQSQRERLRNLRLQGKTHPFYWAAFTLSGQDSH